MPIFMPASANVFKDYPLEDNANIRHIDRHFSDAEKLVHKQNLVVFLLFTGYLGQILQLFVSVSLCFRSCYL